ncbi:hypothetical protein DRO55_02380 [Candidatus Bathyarchaeota archaeon]|nr:MAG: hypothetical protein DRO55_02380 [Candidatus Bathyarchaeota archaeon]
MGCFMPITVRWDGGVSVEYGGSRLIFDPQRESGSYRYVFITHAHYDHSKGFSFKGSEKASTEETKKIVSLYGRKISGWRPLPVGGRVEVDDLEVVAHNAGHVLGSTLYEVITPEGNVVYTGDFQFKDTFTVRAAEPISCDILVVDSTFGSPSFVFPDREELAHEMVE